MVLSLGSGRCLFGVHHSSDCCFSDIINYQSSEASMFAEEAEILMQDLPLLLSLQEKRSTSPPSKDPSSSATICP